MPLVLQRRQALISGRENIGSLLLTVRRLAIFAILLLAYVYYRSAGEAQLASIGLLSFAAIAQLAPAFFGGLLWRRATAAGAIAGMLPLLATAIVAAQGDIYAGLWYPIIVAVMTLIIGLVFLRDTKGVDIVTGSGVAIQNKA